MKLMREEAFFGTVGEKTNYKTVKGEDVHIGDIVKVEILGGAFTVVEPMVKGDDLLGNEKTFVMGVELACDDAEGTVEGRQIVEIVKPYTSLKIGEELGKCNVMVVSDVATEDVTEEETELDACEELAKVMFFGILDKAIADLREAGKDYHGLALIRKAVVDGGID